MGFEDFYLHSKRNVPISEKCKIATWKKILTFTKHSLGEISQSDA